MYNRKQKEKFLAYYKKLKANKPSMITRAEMALNNIEKYEQSWGKDISCQEDINELQKIVDEFSGISTSTRDGRLVALREYCKWCLNEKIEGANSNLLEINGPTSDKLENKTVANPLELQIHLNKILQPENLENIHNVYRAFVWLAYIGFSEKEVNGISCDDVDLESMRITYNDSMFDIYPESLRCIKNCKYMRTFKYSHPLYKENTIDRERVSGNLLLRGFRSDPKESPYYKLNAVISRAQTQAFRAGEITKKVTYHSVWLSGIFYRALQKEQQGISADFYGVAIRYWENISRNNSNDDIVFDPDNNTHRKRVLLLEKSFTNDYKRWKKIFYNM